MKITCFRTGQKIEELSSTSFVAPDALGIAQEMGKILRSFGTKAIHNSYEKVSEEWAFMIDALDSIDSLYDTTDECLPLPSKQRETWALIETLRGILSDLAGPDYTFDYVDGDLYRWSYYKTE